MKKNIFVLLVISCFLISTQVGLFAKTDIDKLSKALEGANSKSVKKIISRIDPNTNQLEIMRRSGFTPLQVAVYYWSKGHYQDEYITIIKDLVNNGADINVAFVSETAPFFRLPQKSILLHKIVQKISEGYRSKAIDKEETLAKNIELFVFFVINGANLRSRNADAKIPTSYIDGDHKGRFFDRLQEGDDCYKAVYNEIAGIYPNLRKIDDAPGIKQQLEIQKERMIREQIQERECEVAQQIQERECEVAQFKDQINFLQKKFAECAKELTKLKEELAKLKNK